MRHEVTTRALTRDEAEEIRRGARSGMGPLPVVIGFAMGYFLALVAFVLFTWGWRTLGFAQQESALYFNSLVFLPMIVGMMGALYVRRDFKRSTKRARRGAKAKKAQVIRVEDSRLVEQEPGNDEGPIYYFGIGGGKVLCLRGQWMYDLDYGLAADDPRRDPERDRPSPFPTPSFTVHRVPLGGHVLRIEQIGESMTAEAVLPFRSRLPAWLRGWSQRIDNSLLVDGDFEDLVRIAESAPSTRTRRTS